MKKSLVISSLVILTSVLAGCNINTNQATNTNSTNTQTNNVNKQNTNNETAISIYVDKNCENAGLQQCNPTILKQQLQQIIKSNINIEYINKDLATKLNQLKVTTPVLVISEENLSKLGPIANQIKAQAKKDGSTYYAPLFGWIAGEENLCNDGKDNNQDGKIDENDPTCYEITILTSSKCNEQYCNENTLKNMFIGYHINILDISSNEEGKSLYNQLKELNGGTQYLPALLLNNKKFYMDQMGNLIKQLTNFKYKYQINIPSFKYDPSIEACAKNCNASSSCKKLLTCNKTDKPKVELFVMSYCPFGTQAEKGILPVVNLLKDKIDFSVKFVNYAMHGKKEIDENNLQYCIQKEEPSKYNTYLTCFLEAGKTSECEEKAKLNMDKINKCIEKVKKDFNTEGEYNNKANWLSGSFPRYLVYDKLNQQYGVQGSPTLIINGLKVQARSRSPQAYLELICSAFKNPPAECNKNLSDQNYDPMWGWTQNGKAAPAGSCGGN